jgi:hypothetical protein
MEKTVQKSDEKTEDSSELNEEKSVISESTDNSKSSSWSSLKKRYKNLWRTRMEDRGFVKGAITSAGSGLMFAAFFALLATTFNGIGMMMYFYLGTIMGSFLGSYRYDLDEFGAFHIGLASGLIPVSIALFSIFLTNPLAGVTLIPVLIIYTGVMGFTNLVYSQIGQDVSNDDS